MKNKLFIGLLRWVGLPLLLAGLLAWAVAPAYTGDTAGAGPVSKPTERNAAAKTVPDADVQELKGRLKELEDATQQNYMLELDGQRKKVDWLLAYLAILAAIIAISGALIPFFMARKDKKIIEQDITQIKQLLAEVKGMKADAVSSVEKIRQHETEAARLLNSFQESGKQPAPEMLQAVEETIKDKFSDPFMRLRAEAISAGQAKDADKAYALWAALAELAPSDPGAQFNAGYWAGMLSENHLAAEKLHWLKLAQQHSALALSHHDAVNNWGNGLAGEAQALAATEPDVARALWKQAGEKYQLALSLKPDDHKVACNWGGALLCEASAIAPSNPEHSKQLLNQAEQLLLAHAEAAPVVMAYNLACVYGLRGDVKNCLKWLKVCQAHKTLPECAHLSGDKGLDSVRDAPEFVEWFKQVCP